MMAELEIQEKKMGCELSPICVNVGCRIAFTLRLFRAC